MNISSNISSLQTNQSFMNANSKQKDLTKEIPNQIIAQGVAEVNVDAIKTQDSMLGTLLDVKV